MGKLITRTSANPELAFVETSEGETPSSLEITRGQNGKYGYTLKQYMPAEVDDEARSDLLARLLATAEEFDEMFREYFCEEFPAATAAGEAGAEKPAKVRVAHA